MTRVVTFAVWLIAAAIVSAHAPPVSQKVESPTVRVLTGLTVPEFEQEMQHFAQAIGVTVAAVICRGVISRATKISTRSKLDK